MAQEVLTPPQTTRPPRPGAVEADLVRRQLMRCDAETLDTRPLAEERAFAYWQRDIPQEYSSLSGEELVARIRGARARLGTRAIVLGHHYQRQDIIQFADLRGDSLKLAQYAARNPDAEYIVFCGVHFMAESADILSAPHQKVVLPNLAAGCSMADMADPEDVLACWDELADLGLTKDTIPITYINSHASLKAFCGRNGGIVCTSTNSPKVLGWAFEKGKRALFLPDQHLGRNTALKLGVPLSEIALWDYRQPFGSLGGNSAAELERARVLLWRGHCSVHQRFTVEQIRKAREEYPGIQVVVHPECTMDVVQAADCDGSTELIVRVITESPAGSRWAVGTEINLVSRLAKENPDKLVFCLDPVVCPCSTMYRVHPAYLCWVMEQLAEGRVVNQVTVEEETARSARIALDRMLAL